VIVIDTARSASSAFGERVEALFDQLAASGVSRLPAERRYRRRALANEHGIEIGADDWKLLEELSRKPDTAARSG
jgi:delta1-piperideine-2-carboxylate reductase